MLKKIYKNNGIIIIENKGENMNHHMKLYYYIANHFQTLYTFPQYITEYYQLHRGFIY